MYLDLVHVIPNIDSAVDCHTCSVILDLLKLDIIS